MKELFSDSKNKNGKACKFRCMPSYLSHFTFHANFKISVSDFGGKNKSFQLKIFLRSLKGLDLTKFPQ